MKMYRNTKKFLETYLLEYLNEMKQRGQVKAANTASIMSFVWMNLVFFMTQFVSDSKEETIENDEFIENSDKLFVKGLQN